MPGRPPQTPCRTFPSHACGARPAAASTATPSRLSARAAGRGGRHDGLRWINIERPGPVDRAWLEEHFEFHPLDLRGRPLAQPAAEDRRVRRLPVHRPALPGLRQGGRAAERRRARHLRRARLPDHAAQHAAPAGRVPVRALPDVGGGARRSSSRRARATCSTRSSTTAFDYCFPMLRKIGNKLDRIEEDIFEGRSDEVVRDISNVKQEIINFRKIIRPQRPVLRDLERTKQRYLAEDLELYFDDIVDASERIWDMLENYKEVVEALEDTNESVLSHRVNDVLRVLTAISVVVLPLTLRREHLGHERAACPARATHAASSGDHRGHGRAAVRDARLLRSARLAVDARRDAAATTGLAGGTHGQHRGCSARRRSTARSTPRPAFSPAADVDRSAAAGSPCAAAQAAVRASASTRPVGAARRRRGRRPRVRAPRRPRRTGSLQIPSVRTTAAPDHGRRQRRAMPPCRSRTPGPASRMLSRRSRAPETDKGDDARPARVASAALTPTARLPIASAESLLEHRRRRPRPAARSARERQHHAAVGALAPRLHQGTEARRVHLLRRSRARPTTTRASYIVHRGEHCFVILNAYPYNNGHLMVAPYGHVASIEELDERRPARADGADRRARSAALREVVRPGGLQLGINQGEVGGRRHRGPRAPARGAALGRRHELHAGDRRHARAAPEPRRLLRPR